MTSVLASFGIQAQNAGTWIGRRSLFSDQWISSSSPVDGVPIAQVSETSTSQYHEVIEAVRQLRKFGAMSPLQSAAKPFAFLATNSANKKKRLACWFPMKWENPIKRA
jgi:hypothetical protein